MRVFLPYFSVEGDVSILRLYLLSSFIILYSGTFYLCNELFPEVLIFRNLLCVPCGNVIELQLEENVQDDLLLDIK